MGDFSMKTMQRIILACTLVALVVAQSPEPEDSFVSQLVQGISPEPLSLAEIYPEDKTLGQHKAAEELYDQQVEEYNRMEIDYLLQVKTAPETELMAFPKWVETEADIEKYLSSQKATVVHKARGHEATAEELTQITSNLSGRLFKDCAGTMKHVCLMCQAEYRKIRRNPAYFKDGVQKVKVLPDMPSDCDDESEFLA